MNVGGPAVLLKELIDNLPENEFEHILITGRCLSNEIDYLKEHPIKSSVIYIDSLKRSILPTRDLVSFFKLIVLLKHLRPDIVHTHTSKAGVLGRIAAKMASRDIRIIHTFHGHILYGYFNKLITFAYRIVEVALGKITDDAVAITTPVMTDLQRARIALKARWHVIHPGIFPSISLTKKRFESDREIKVFWIGRFAAVKNPVLAVEAFSKFVLHSNSPATLTMIGDGDLYSVCKGMSESLNLPIIFTGWQDDVQERLKDADLLLLTSLNEGLGLVMLEAGLQKVPTLATPVGGVSDFIIDEKTGYIARMDANDFAEKMIKIFSSASQRHSIGEAAQEKVLKDFSVENFIRNHINLYRDGTLQTH